MNLQVTRIIMAVSGPVLSQFMSVKLERRVLSFFMCENLYLLEFGDHCLANVFSQYYRISTVAQVKEVQARKT